MKIDLTTEQLNYVWKALEHYGNFHGEVMRNVKEQAEKQLAPPVADSHED